MIIILLFCPDGANNFYHAKSQTLKLYENPYEGMLDHLVKSLLR
jgi:hypothetical protein